MKIMKIHFLETPIKQNNIISDEFIKKMEYVITPFTMKNGTLYFNHFLLFHIFVCL